MTDITKAALYFKRGQLFNPSSPDQAVREFTRSVSMCSTGHRELLARSLFWLGISLFRLGQRSPAVKAWLQARRLSRSRPLERVFECHVNEYGMPRCSCSDLDDWNAFRSIQTVRYLSKKDGGCFSSRAERDALVDLLFDAWKPLRASGRLAGMKTSAKLALFRAARPSLPIASFDSIDSSGSSGVLKGRFRGVSRGLVRDNDSCPCHSGLASSRCCSHIESVYTQTDGYL